MFYIANPTPRTLPSLSPKINQKITIIINIVPPTETSLVLTGVQSE